MFSHRSRLLSVTLSVVVSVVAATMFGGVASASADAAGADGLQERVDTYLAHFPDSRQVAPNKVVFPGGEVNVGLAAPAPCASGWLCMWKYDNGFDDVQYYYCGTYALPNWVGYGGFENNQTEGTVARFENQHHELLWTSTAYDFEDDTVYWTPVWYVTPC